MQYVFFVQLLIMILVPFVKMVLRALGFGFVTYVGINLIIDQAKNYIMSEIGGAGTTVLNILGLMKADVAINIMLAAVTTRFILAGLDKASGSMRRQVWQKPGSGGSFEA